MLRKLLLTAAVLSLAGAGVFAFWRPWGHAESPPPKDTTASPELPNESFYAAPDFAPQTEWLQSEPLTWTGLRGKVVVVHFWTFGCINCKHNYLAYKGWHEKYGGKGVTVIGIHTPEFDYEADAKEVQAQANKNGLKFPIALDRGGQNWQKWENRYWPTIYLVDKKGKVRHRWEGELESAEVNGRALLGRQIDELLAEK